MNITLYFPDGREMELEVEHIPRIGEQLAIPTENINILEWYQVANVAHYTSKLKKKVMFVAVMLKRIL